ncbi:hypothetical protein BCV69DRAFT_88378 [Microstroma glucosiphilum]|uniref:Uncharacterized protein n=1 Tax=Pseudomicrostroma glucosiphilum TaxID=1684307 RepID=A0A316U4P2_9BASI|nr:hypothetical protein BCV69DRAFT_88378 [Pseudomicrostroma glucosiphilum]PWN17915.1 hypothetical protein BCV69DRAFT_88378 [Pseudomicrostroma glucosiphilum]
MYHYQSERHCPLQFVHSFPRILISSGDDCLLSSLRYAPCLCWLAPPPFASERVVAQCPRPAPPVPCRVNLPGFDFEVKVSVECTHTHTHTHTHAEAQLD